MSPRMINNQLQVALLNSIINKLENVGARDVVKWQSMYLACSESQSQHLKRKKNLKNEGMDFPRSRVKRTSIIKMKILFGEVPAEI